MKNKNSSQLRKGKQAVPPVIGVILMVAITVILAAVIGAFVFGVGGPPSAPSFYIQTEEVINEDYLKINASHAFDSGPLPNVTVAIYEPRGRKTTFWSSND